MIYITSNFVVRALGPALSFLALMLYTRYVDKEFFGQIIIYINFLVAMQAIIACGVPNLIIRNINTELAIAKNPTLFRTFLKQSIIVFPVIALFALTTSISLYLIFFTYLLALGNLFLVVIRYYSKLIVYNLLSGSLFILLQIFFIPFVHVEAIRSPLIFITIISITFVVICFLFTRSFPISRINVKSIFNQSDFENLKKSFQVGSLAIISTLNTTVDIIILGILTNASIVAEYKLNSFVIFVITFFSSTYCIIIANDMGKMKRKSVRSYFNLNIKKFAIVTLIYIICSAISCLTLLPPFLKMWSNSAYNLSSYTLIPFISTGIFVSLYAYFIVLYIHLDLQMRFLRPMVAGLLINILLNFLLIPSFGMIGASASTAITNFYMLVISYYFYRQNIRYVR